MARFDACEVVTIRTADGKEYSKTNWRPNIFDERHITRDKPSWHQLGKVFTDNPTVSEGTQRAGADYLVEAFPVTINAYGREIETAYKALVREPMTGDDQPRVFGVAGKLHVPMQNTEIARILDPLTEFFPLETVTVLGKGERTLWCFKTGDIEVEGDLVTGYLGVVECKEPGNALLWSITPVRFECQNTMAVGLAAAIKNVSIRHTELGKVDLDFYVQVKRAVGEREAVVAEAMRHLATTPVEAPQIEAIFAEAYPYKQPSDKIELFRSLTASQRRMTDPAARERIEKAEAQLAEFNTRQAEARSRTLVLMDRFNQTQKPNLANTAWAAVQAVAENEDWYREMDNSGRTKDRAVSTLYGDRAATKTRSFEAAIKL